MGVGVAAEACPKATAADLPAHVKAWAAPQQLGWLDSPEACVVFPGRKTRHRLRLSIAAILHYLAQRRRDGLSDGGVDLPSPSRHESRLEYPHPYVNERSAHFPDRRCACDACHGRAWPYPHVGSAGPKRWQWISYECHVLRDSEMLANDPTPANDPRRLTERDAMNEGLTIKASQANRDPLPEMVPGCQRCGRNRRKGDRYCAVCAKAARRMMVREGYLRH